jgi:D-glycero-alpha-D-manno-heptose-7-phosphate kinase
VSPGRAAGAAPARVVRASAPCRVDLAGGALEAWPLYLFHPGAVALSVAIDRRVACRVETGIGGVEIESRDTLRRRAAPTVAALLAEDGKDLAALVLQALGVTDGMRVATHARVPASAGLGAQAALALALTAAVARAVGRELGPDQTVAFARDVELRARGTPAGVRGYQTGLRGGVVALDLGPGTVTVERPVVDPARVEESLLLVETAGDPAEAGGDWDAIKAELEGDAAVHSALAEIASLTPALRAALTAGRGDEVAALRRREWAAVRALGAGRTSAAVDRVVELVEAAGGAGEAAEGGSVVAVWAPPGARGPGPREAVIAALGASGLEPHSVRVDLRGLELEEAPGKAL